MKELINNMPYSDIGSVYVLNNKIYFITFYKNETALPLTRMHIDTFLNDNSAKTNGIRAITTDLEKQLAQIFYPQLTLKNGKYKYQLSANEKLAQKLVAKAPEYIQYKNHFHHVIDSNNKELTLGITNYKRSLSAIKLGEPANTQNKLNEIIVKVTKEFTSLKHVRYLDRTDIFNSHGKLPENLFSYDEKYIHKSIVLPSKAINSLYHNNEEILIECAAASNIIYYKVILDFLGAKKFNKLFKNKIKILSRPDLHESELNKFFDQTGNFNKIMSSASGMNKFTVGDEVYFKNINVYYDKHPYGNFPGHNVVYLGKNNLGEHEFGGLFIDKKIHTHQNVIDSFIKDYNLDPILNDKDRITLRAMQLSDASLASSYDMQHVAIEETTDNFVDMMGMVS
jgi:hypothetical protein